MLVLTRRIGETLAIGDNVTVTVLGIEGDQVSIGTDAPRHVPTEILGNSPPAQTPRRSPVRRPPLSRNSVT